MNIQELRDGLAYVESLLTEIHERTGTAVLEGDDQTAWDEGQTFVLATRAQIAEYEARDQLVGSVQRGGGRPADVPNFIRTPDAAEDVVSRQATDGEIRDTILRQLEANDADDTVARTVLKRHQAADPGWARNLAIRSTDTYSSAFSKMLTGRHMNLSDQERAALSGSTAAEGGVMVPTHLDPTIILTNDGSANVMRQIATVKTHTVGDTWVGVASAGVTASNDARQTEVSDDTPADFSAPTVVLHTPQAFIQAEREALADIANLTSDVLMLFADARDRLEGANHCTGSGTNAPFGIFTALDANTNVELTTTTAATIGLVDLQAQRRAVGQRWRGRSSWLMNPTWADEIKALGAALSASYSTDITQSNTERLLGRPVVETDDAPEVTTTTVKDNRIVFGDFSNYYIVDKPGSTSVEYIPHLFNTANNLPDGRVGWVMYWRSGADSVNDLAFRLLQDKTSA